MKIATVVPLAAGGVVALALCLLLLALGDVPDLAAISVAAGQANAAGGGSIDWP